MIDVTINANQFNAAMRELAQKTGRSFSSIIKAEAASILKAAVGNTGAATVKTINARYDYKGDWATPKTIIKRTRLNGVRVDVRSIKKRGMRVTTKKKSYWDPNRINPQFKILSAKLKRMKKYAKDNRGQSKATWLYVAKRLKLNLDVAKGKKIPDIARKALGILPASLKKKLRGWEEGEADYVITIKNAGRTAMAPASKKGPGGFDAFRKSINGRTKFFQTNLRLGVFKDVKKTLDKYPGLAATP